MTDINEVKLRVRAHDPMTSIATAERSTRFSETHKGRILSALEELGSATAHDISVATGLHVTQIDRRLPEARREGLAGVLQLAGEDVVRGGFRVWRLTGVKFCPPHNINNM